MRDDDCVAFLQWCLPKLHKRWPGFRKVRNQVCKRIDRRIQTLGLDGPTAYRSYLDAHPDEWATLDAMCRITISRFYRDRGVFDTVRHVLLPELAQLATTRGDDTLRCWSAGCASGEEVYTLKILWHQGLQARYPNLQLRIVATDVQAHMLDRARRGCYQRGTLKELPDAWVDVAFRYTNETEEPYCIRPIYRTDIEWRQHDIRDEMPDGRFHLILCRNLVFTYFDEALQRSSLHRLHAHLHPNGILMLGKHETLPDRAEGWTVWDEHQRIYRSG